MKKPLFFSFASFLSARAAQALGVYLLTMLTLSACKNSKEPPLTPSPPLIPVIVTHPQSLDIPIYLEAMGTLSAKASVEVRAQVSGLLERVLVDEGQWVKAGTALFKIEARPYQIKLEQAQAQLSLHRADLELTCKKLERYKSLAQKDFVSQTEWDELLALQAKAQASVSQDLASVDGAQLDLDHCTLKAPIDGRIGKIHPKVGSLIHASGDLLTDLCTLDPLYVEFYLTEGDFAQIPDEAGSLELRPLADPHQLYQGTITFWDNQFDTKTGLIYVRGLIANPQQLLHPGQSVQLSIPVACVLDAITIPQKAVRFNQKGPYVFVVTQDNQVKICQITLGDEHGEAIVVTEGLDASDTIILDGHLRLNEGAKVDIRPNPGEKSADQPLKDFEQDPVSV